MLPQPAASPTKVVVFGQEFTLVETNAPKAYDYDCIPVIGDEDDGSRLVLVPTFAVETQTTRYRSGLYYGVLSDLYNADTLTDMLYTRLIKGNA